MKIELGAEREIVMALVRDFDGDGTKDALVIARPPASERKPSSPTGDLVFLRGGEGARPSIVASGPPLGLQAACVPTARLEKIGPRSAFAEIGNHCPRGAGARTVVVVRLGGSGPPALAFDAILVDPPHAPKLSIDVDAADRDRDGIDDVVLRLAIEGMTKDQGDVSQRLAAKLAFFDRPAGPSRDPEEPEASLKLIASQLVAKATKPKEAMQVPPLVAQMRALYRAMCNEGGAPRVTKIHGGSATSCGTSKALEDAGVAEVRAWVTRGDALHAYAAALEAQLAPAAKTAAKTTEMQRALAEVASVVEARSVRAIVATPDQPRDGHPEWGPLTFESSGKLLVRHGKNVMRVDPENGEEEQATDVQAWRDEVISPDGKSRFIEAYHACEGVTLRATFAPTGDGDMSDVPLPIAPHLGKSCKGATNARGEAASTIPIAWGTRGLEVIVAGQPVLIKLDPAEGVALPLFFDEVPPLGSPRSHNAKTIAVTVPNANGVLLRGRDSNPNGKWSLVRAAELEPYIELRRCTSNDDGSRLACVRRGRALIVTLP